MTNLPNISVRLCFFGFELCFFRLKNILRFLFYDTITGMHDNSTSQKRSWGFQPGNRLAVGHGRPKKTRTEAERFADKVKRDLKSAAKEFSAEALSVIVEILRDKKLAPQYRLAAASQILDRSHGKARHHVDVVVDPYERYTNSQLINFILGKELELEVSSQEPPALGFLHSDTCEAQGN